LRVKGDFMPTSTPEPVATIVGARIARLEMSASDLEATLDRIEAGLIATGQIPAPRPELAVVANEKGDDS
jgi:hypothetical protein